MEEIYAPVNLRVTIEEVVGDSSTILHNEVREVPEGMHTERAIRFMLAEASEKFYQLEKVNFPET